MSASSTLFGGHRSVYDFIQRRRRGQLYREEQLNILQVVHTRSVATLTENPIRLKNHDKIFTSAWISMTMLSKSTDMPIHILR